MKKFKMLVSGVLTAAMVLGSTIAYANPAPSLVSGTNTVTNPTFAVLLPTAPAIRLNPFQIGTTPTVTAPQISAGWSVIANRSNVPVSVEVRVAPSTTAVGPVATATSRASFVANPLAVGGDDVFLQLNWATRFNAPGTMPTNTATAANLSLYTLWDDCTTCDDANVALQTTFNNSAAVSAPIPAHIVPVLTGGTELTRINAEDRGGHAFRVLLDSHSVNAATGAVAPGAMTANQLAAFTFSGELDYNETWAAGAVNARVIFAITGVSKATYAETVSTATPLGRAHRVFEVTP